MVYRDSSTDASRDGTDQKRKDDPDVFPIDTRAWSLADEKRYDPDAPGTASDYAGTTTAHRSGPLTSGAAREDNSPYDADEDY